MVKMVKSIATATMMLALVFGAGPTSNFVSSFYDNVDGAALCDVGVLIEYPNCAGGNNPTTVVICRNLAQQSWEPATECFWVNTHEQFIFNTKCSEHWDPLNGNLGCTGDYEFDNASDDCTDVVVWCGAG